MHFRNVMSQINNTSAKDTVPHLFCFLEWSTSVVISTISVTAPRTEPTTIPVRLPEK